jgi:hypothetical protein
MLEGTMSSPFVFEREPFNTDSGKHYTQRDFPPYLELDAVLPESPSFRNRRADGLWSEVSSGQKLNCSGLTTDCSFMTPQEERKVRRAGKPEGDMIDRTEGDPDKNLKIQLTDYDVNEWRAGQKDRHRLGLERVIKFIVDRRKEIAESAEGIAITISGSASRTGTKQYNDILSCKRAVCVAQFIHNMLSFPVGGAPSLLNRNKIKFNVAGEGFEKAKCVGADCEVGEFRSVLISVHRPGVKEKPIPIVPLGWDKYRIRCCSFKTESLGEVFITELLERGINALPPPLRKILEESDVGKKILEKAIKELIKQLKNLLKRAPGALGKLFGALLKRFPIPVEFIRDMGVFQIVDRDKPDAKEIILCYTGFGLRITFPRSIPGLMDAIPESLREGLKKLLKENLKLDLPTDILFNVVSGKIPAIESSTPGPFTEFDVKPGRNRPMINLKGFEGPGEVFKGIEIGKVVVGFSSPRTFSRPDPKNGRESVARAVVETASSLSSSAPEQDLKFSPQPKGSLWMATASVSKAHKNSVLER